MANGAEIESGSVVEAKSQGRIASEWRLWFWLGVSCWFLLIFFHQRHYDAPTPVSRLDLIMAICLEHRLTIDSFEKNTPDKAVVDGYYYSDKAPGTVALALVGSAPAIWIGGALGWTVEDKRLWLAASWAGCAVLDVVLAAGFVCLVRLLWGILAGRNGDAAKQRNSDAAKERKNIQDAPRSDAPAPRLADTPTPQFADSSFKVGLATSIFIIFGGMAWPYATMMFSHAQAIGCIAIGLWFLYRAEPGLFSLEISHKGRKDHKEDCSGSPIHRFAVSPLFWAGFAFGWALNSEYTTGLIVFGVPMILFWGRWRNWVPFFVGLIGPCLLIPLYSWATVGVPWKLPYSYQASFPEMSKGLYAIQWPDATVAFNLLFSPERGLLFWCPFLAMAGFGYPVLIRENARLFLLTYFLPILQLVVISGRVWDWPAGPSFSARYLAPIVPLLAIPCAFGFRRFPWIGIFPGIASLALTAAATVTNAAPGFNEHPNPLIDLNWPLVTELDFGPNLVSQLLGLPSFICVAVFALLAIVVFGVSFGCLRSRYAGGYSERP